MQSIISRYPNVFANYTYSPKLTTLSDVIDGFLYQQFRLDCNSNKAFSFTINTDGVHLSDKSDIALWPVFLAINELPLNERFSFNNVIIAGEFIKIKKIDSYYKIFKFFRTICWAKAKVFSLFETNY